MNSATIVLWCIAGVLFLYSWKEGTDTVKRGGLLAWETTKQNALLLILAFIIVGFVNILSPDELVKPGSVQMPDGEEYCWQNLLE